MTSLMCGECVYLDERVNDHDEIYWYCPVKGIHANCSDSVCKSFLSYEEAYQENSEIDGYAGDKE